MQIFSTWSARSNTVTNDKSGEAGKIIQIGWYSLRGQIRL
jgi:hypothetical protein